MIHDDFNAAHPTHADRNRGWEPILPFEKRKAAHTHMTTRHIFILAEQLFYDIDATTGLLARSLRNTQGAPDIATQEADTYRPMFFRWFDKYIRKAERIMSVYVLKPERRNRNDALREWQERDITLSMPDYWDDTLIDALSSALHDYIVCGALYEYLSVSFSPADARAVAKQSELADIETDIQDLVNRPKPGSIHKHFSPF